MLEVKNKSKNKEKLFLVFDIGSGSVGGAMVKTTDSPLPTIIKSNRVDIKSSDNVKLEDLFSETIKTLEEVSNNIYQSKLGAPEKIFCVLSSPWYISETRIIKTRRDNPFVFTKELANELFLKEISSLTNFYRNKYDNKDGNPEIIENYIMSVTTNGYPCANPIGVKTNSIEMNMVVSISPKMFIDKITNSISKSYPHIKITFSSFAIASFMAVMDQYPDSNSYILLDIAGEITDVSIVIDGAFKNSLSFPCGKNTLFRKIAQDLKVEQRDIEELFNLYITNTLENKKSQKSELVFKSAEEFWSKSFREAILGLNQTFTLPDTIFLTADDIIKPWFSNILSKEENLKFMITGHEWKITTLDGPSFLNKCKVSSGGCDPFLMIEAIASVNK